MVQRARIGISCTDRCDLGRCVLGTIVAQFGENVATNGVPEWRLASFGFTNDFDANALIDHDMDGHFTWEESIAGTDPTNALSVFQITTIQLSPDQMNVEIEWTSVSNRTYEVDRAAGPGGVYTNLASDIPGDPPTDTLIRSVGDSTGTVFRVTVEKP